MKKLLTIIIALLIVNVADARTVRHAKKEVVSKFNSNLNALIRTANQPSGFDALKQLELSRGVWNCKLELDGFIPTVEAEPLNPTEKLIVSAISISPAGRNNAKMLLTKGLKGYKMRDSDNDKSIEFDRSRYTRKVVFKKTEKFVESTVTVSFIAHQYETVQITIESWQ